MSINIKKEEQSNQLITWLHVVQKTLSLSLQQFFLDQQAAYSFDLTGQFMLESLSEFTLRGGKRIRPALLYYSYQGLAKPHSNTDTLMPLMIACELMQSFFLVHDDIVDEAELRRGGKTIHHIFYEKPAYDNWRSAESMAIFTGNIAGYLGMKAISESHLEDKHKWQIMKLYAEVCIDVNYGQTLDIVSWPLEHLTEESIHNIYYYKTASYTTQFPLLCSAILTNSNEKMNRNLKQIGKHMGFLFQARDDLLGIFSNPSVIGKSVVSDIQQGKKTLLIYEAWKRSTLTQKEYLKRFYGNPQTGPKEIEEIKNIMLDTGTLRYIQNVIQQQAEQAKLILGSLSLNESGKTFIEHVINDLTDGEEENDV
ncbi:MAG: Polyprenyl synthetase [Alphaproteobacteria bacterium]|nr:Polyprenyl synthetase [Alphaproteobacteria bacterium]MDF3033047.1 Polyprenyl synthetase [Alphaproteobacteria bacterium]